MCFTTKCCYIVFGDKILVVAVVDVTAGIILYFNLLIQQLQDPMTGSAQGDKRREEKAIKE
jgi:hypothetical protein